MADVFCQENAKNLLDRKYILFIGDSNVRSLYKDLLWLVSRGGLVTSCFFSRKLGNSFLGDRVLDNDGNEYSWHFFEHRSYNKDFRIDLFHMSTVETNWIDRYVHDLKDGVLPEPDVVFFSSYCSKRSLNTLEDALNKLKNQLPKQTLFLMAKALPMIKDSFGDPLIEEIIYFKSARIDVSHTEYCEMASRLGFMTIDPYFYTQLEIFRGFDSRRDRKGLRFLTNLILTKYAIHLDRELPGRVDSLILRQAQLSSLACIKEYRNLERRISSGGCIPKNDPALINATQFLKNIKTNKHFFYRSDTYRKRKATSKQLNIKLRRIGKSPTELMEIEAANLPNNTPPSQGMNANGSGKKGKSKKRKGGYTDIKKMSSYRGGVIKSVVFPLSTSQNQGCSNQGLFLTKSNTTNFTPPKVSQNPCGMDEMPSRLDDSSLSRSMFGQTYQSKTGSVGEKRDVSTTSSDAQNGTSNSDRTKNKNQPNFFTEELPTAQVEFSEKDKTPSRRNAGSRNGQNFMSWLSRNFNYNEQTENQDSLHSSNINVEGKSNEESLPPVIGPKDDTEKRSDVNAKPVNETQHQVDPKTKEGKPNTHIQGSVSDIFFQKQREVNSANKPELLNMSRFLFDLREKLNVSGPKAAVNVSPTYSTQQSANFKTFSFRNIPHLKKFNTAVEDNYMNPFSIKNVSLKSLSVQPAPKRWRVRNKSGYIKWQHFPFAQSVRGSVFCKYWPPPVTTRTKGQLFDTLD